MFDAIDNNGYDNGPILNNKLHIAIIYVAFLLVTTYFVMNLFVSVIVDKFNDEIKKQGSSTSLSSKSIG